MLESIVLHPLRPLRNLEWIAWTQLTSSLLLKKASASIFQTRMRRTESAVSKTHVRCSLNMFKRSQRPQTRHRIWEQAQEASHLHNNSENLFIRQHQSFLVPRNTSQRIRNIDVLGIVLTLVDEELLRHGLVVQHLEDERCYVFMTCFSQDAVHICDVRILLLVRSEE